MFLLNVVWYDLCVYGQMVFFEKKRGMFGGLKNYDRFFGMWLKRLNL